ncbi:MAG: hypothetical protein PF501_13430 [Salinisphaera sp.]|jgi:type VI protein secretion system component VasK|nr:hypothetical protein [Salinisphaera sp.]
MPRAYANTSVQREAAKLRTLSLINWILLTCSILASLIGAAVCLLMWPFPQMAGDSGTTFGNVVVATMLGLLVAVTAALSTWLLDKRHPALWLGQCLLAIVVVCALVYGLALQ